MCSLNYINVPCLPPDAAPLDTQSSPSPSSSASRHASVDSDHATREFIDFLKPLKSGREIFKQCRAFTETMVYKRVSLSCAANKFLCVFMGEIHSMNFHRSAYWKQRCWVGPATSQWGTKSQCPFSEVKQSWIMDNHMNYYLEQRIFVWLEA